MEMVNNKIRRKKVEEFFIYYEHHVEWSKWQLSKYWKNNRVKGAETFYLFHEESERIPTNTQLKIYSKAKTDVWKLIYQLLEVIISPLYSGYVYLLL